MNVINVHPMFVHFPIALLVLYSVLEILRFQKIQMQPYMFYIKAILVILGAASILVVQQTGDLAAQAFRGDQATRKIISMHENFSDIALAFYAVIAACYLISWLDRAQVLHFQPGTSFEKLWTSLLKLKSAFIETKFVVFLALVGLIAITVTGALGGSIVYGPNTDPVVHFIYNLLIK